MLTIILFLRHNMDRTVTELRCARMKNNFYQSDMSNVYYETFVLYYGGDVSVIRDDNSLTIIQVDVAPNIGSRGINQTNLSLNDVDSDLSGNPVRPKLINFRNPRSIHNQKDPL